MILEAALLNIKPALEGDFESAFKKASNIISSALLNGDMNPDVET